MSPDSDASQYDLNQVLHIICDELTVQAASESLPKPFNKKLSDEKHAPPEPQVVERQLPIRFVRSIISELLRDDLGSHRVH